jgi:hypothetical protein
MMPIRLAALGSFFCSSVVRNVDFRQKSISADPTSDKTKLLSNRRGAHDGEDGRSRKTAVQAVMKGLLPRAGDKIATEEMDSFSHELQGEIPIGGQAGCQHDLVYITMGHPFACLSV